MIRVPGSHATSTFVMPRVSCGGCRCDIHRRFSVSASRNGSKKPKPLQVPCIEVTPPLLKPPRRRRVTGNDLLLASGSCSKSLVSNASDSKRHCAAAVEQHRSDIDNSTALHSQRGSKILLVAACALIRGDKVLCAQRPAGKRRGGEPWQSCMTGQHCCAGELTMGVGAGFFVGACRMCWDLATEAIRCQQYAVARYAELIASPSSLRISPTDACTSPASS